MRRVIIDTDTASDDAVALVCALRNKTIDVVAITTVAGNVELEQATQNALMSVEYAASYKPPVYVGCEKPLMVELETADQVHGIDGMGDVGTLRQPETKPEAPHAADAIIDIVKNGGGDIEILTLGPLTNIALAMRKAPEVMKKVPRITIMGGAHHYHNPHSVCAEFNIMVDPDAADIVCSFGVPFTMVTLEACLGEAKLGPDMIQKLRAKGEIGNFCVDCNRTMIMNHKDVFGFEAFDLPDPVTVAVFSRPEMAKTKFSAYTRVETKGRFARGATIFAQYNTQGEQGFGYDYSPNNSEIVTQVDGAQFHEYLLDCM